MPEDYDLFISYSHRDNHDGWVEALVDALQAEHAEESRTQLRIFLDVAAIPSMSYWEHHILGALRSSKFMLAVVSPNFFASDYCRKEWELFAEHEARRSIAGDGIAKIYTVTVPEMDDQAKLASDPWLLNMHHRQNTVVDLRQWRPEGRAGLDREEVRAAVQLLYQNIIDALNTARRVSASPTTIPPCNPQFVGRADELRQLHTHVFCGQVGVIATLHGLGGMGKSALAFEYANAYADKYPGGRFLISCAGVDDLRIPFINLAEAKGVTLTDDERKNLDAAFAKVRLAFERGERSLLLLDNVDDPKLLSPTHRAASLPQGEKVHVLATTRLDPALLTGVHCLPLDALPEPDALRLLEKYRPFADAAERAAAQSIVRRLGGHALAVEVVAVYLWKTAEEGVTYAGYLERLTEEGLESLDTAGQDDRVELSRHQQKVLSQLLAPTLSRLSPPEQLAVQYASLLPPDHIPLPWLQALVGEQFPEFATTPKPGHPDPWKRLERRLLGLRMLTMGDVPQLARMHRLTQDVVAADFATERAFQTDGDNASPLLRAFAKVGRDLVWKRLVVHGEKRGEYLHDRWMEQGSRWEIQPLHQFALSVLDAGHADGYLVLGAARPLIELGQFNDARELLSRDVAIKERVFGAGSAKLTSSLWHLAKLQRYSGHLNEARLLLERLVTFWQRKCGPEHKATSICYEELAAVEYAFRNLTRSGDLVRQTIAIRERAYPGDDSQCAYPLQILALIEHKLGHLSEARLLFQRSLKVLEKSSSLEDLSVALLLGNFAMLELDLGHVAEAREAMERAAPALLKAPGPDHFNAAFWYRNMAAVEQRSGDPEAARVMLRRAIAINEKILGPDHFNLALLCHNLAKVEHDLGNLEQGHSLMRRAHGIWKATFGAQHPDTTRASNWLSENDPAWKPEPP